MSYELELSDRGKRIINAKDLSGRRVYRRILKYIIILLWSGEVHFCISV